MLDRRFATKTGQRAGITDGGKVSTVAAGQHPVFYFLAEQQRFNILQFRGIPDFSKRMIDK